MDLTAAYNDNLEIIQNSFNLGDHLFKINNFPPVVGVHEDGEGHWEEMNENDPDYMRENYPDWEPEPVPEILYEDDQISEDLFTGKPTN